MQIISRPGWGRRAVVGLAVAGATFGIASAVQASIPDSNGIVHACYTTNNLNGYPNGALRAIDTAKVNGRCTPNEAPVDLATPQYVQNVVNSTVNQTVITGAATFPFQLSAGDHYVQWTCGGWVATDPTVSVDPVTSSTAQAPIALHAVTNLEAQSNSGPFGTTVKIFFTLASPQNIHTQVQCVDPRVFGETYPVSGPAGKPTATVQ
jgi:hypothetical protein